MLFLTLLKVKLYIFIENEPYSIFNPIFLVVFFFFPQTERSNSDTAVVVIVLKVVENFDLLSRNLIMGLNVRFDLFQVCKIL